MSCAIGHAVLDVLENENMMKNAQSVGTYAIDQLNILKQRHEIIGDVRCSLVKLFKNLFLKNLLQNYFSRSTL